MLGWMFLTGLVGVLPYGEACTFPDYLRNPENTYYGDYWRFNTRLSGAEVQVEVKETVITGYSTMYGKEDLFPEVAFSGTCLEKIASKPTPAYLVYLESSSLPEFENGTNHSVCIQFLPVSHSHNKVVLVNISEPFEGNDPNICSKPRQLDNSPLIANKNRPVVSHECILTGGFTFSTTTQQYPHKPTPVCKGHIVPPFLEADCTTGDGLRFLFPENFCVPDKTGWGTDQFLHCMESWTEGDYTFQLLGEEYDNPRWCMRINSTEKVDAPRTVEIFQDMVCPTEAPPNDTHILILNITLFDTWSPSLNNFLGLSPQLCNNNCNHPLLHHYCRFSCGISETCFDASGQSWCEKDKEFICSNEQSRYCLKTCKQCTPQHPCEFQSTLIPRGVWRGNDVTHDVIFSDQFINMSHYNPLACHQKLNRGTFINTVVTAPGCRLRFSCIRVHKSHPDAPLISYKIGQNVLWYEHADEYSMCKESRFTDDPPPLKNKVHSQYMKQLQPLPRYLNASVPCGFGGTFAVNSSDCWGHISDLEDCKPQGHVTLSLECGISENVTEKFFQEFRCLGSEIKNQIEPGLIVTTLTDRVNDYNTTCWVVHHVDEKSAILYQMQAIPCNPGVLWQIQARPQDVSLELDAYRVDGCFPPTSPPQITYVKYTPGVIAVFVAFCISMIILLSLGAIKATKFYKKIKAQENPYRMVI